MERTLRKIRKPFPSHLVVVLLLLALLVLPVFGGGAASAASQPLTTNQSLSQGLSHAFQANPPNPSNAYTQTTELIPSDSTDKYYFGSAVSLSADGNTALVGGFGQYDEGVAYIFTKNGNTWSQTAKLKSPDFDNTAYFGNSVSLSADGNTALIGAVGQSPSNILGAGAAYIFTKNGNAWNQIAELTASDAIRGAAFGETVSLSADGSTALIGSRNYTVNGKEAAGTAYIFTKNSNSWSQAQELTATDGAAQDNFGVDVGLSADGSIAAVGALNHAVNNLTGAGAVYLFSKNNGKWSQTQELSAVDKAKSNSFGRSISLSADANTLLISSPGSTNNNASIAGAAYIFNRNNGNWSQVAELAAPDSAANNYFGQSLSLSADGNTALIGAAGHTTKGDNAGNAYTFAKNGSSWNQTAELTASDEKANDNFANAVALSYNGSTALIGADVHVNGAAYIFTSPSTNPIIIATPGQPQTWRDSGFALPTITVDNTYKNPVTSCLDATQPNRLLYAQSDATQTDKVGTYAYDWLTGQKTFISTNVLQECNGNQLYGYDAAQSTQATIAFSVADPTGKTIAHYPTVFAPSNAQLLYSDIYSNATNSINAQKLWVSSDGGQTWQDRTPQPADSLSLVTASSDGKMVYVLASNLDTKAEVYNYTLYFSTDAGATWQKRYQTSLQGGLADDQDGLELLQLQGQNSPNYVELYHVSAGIAAFNTISLSVDGGKTFNEAGELFDSGGAGDSEFAQIFYTDNGIIREEINQQHNIHTLTRTTDGKNYQNLALPFTLNFSANSLLHQDPKAPNNLFLTDPSTGDLWWSPDAGQTWQKAGTNLNNISELTVLSYTPLTLTAFDKNRELYLLDGLARTAPVAASTASGNFFFKETGHNLSGVFLQYWQAHGGLAQFGFPKTEQFWEYNPADGKFYLVQYFERNRFEYHPEFAGSQYEVELGLLGDQQTANRHQETPFQPVKNPNTAGTMYFSQTGHTLSGKFLNYWNANGGLSIYGYPISEPFQEVNPDDGKTYTVQYFERARFEYHPEFANTKYEVELGLLGNTLLESEGWLKQ